jgi:NADH dehydrogenase FAD-containing subunit
MFAHPLEEVRAHATLMLTELRKVIPAFLARIDQPGRGDRWIQYFAETRRAVAEQIRPLVECIPAEPRDEVTLTEFDPDGEIKVVASALYAVSSLPDDQLLAIARQMPSADRAGVLRAYVGDRANRRHKPGRAFERTRYRFDVLADYGAFRDLQRHRLLTLEWQPLSPEHGYVEPAAIEEAGALADWRSVMEQSAGLYDQMIAAGLRDAAPYAVVMAYRVRFYMEMNAREAMHVIELRTAPQGHPSYRRVCQTMHRLIAERAGHRALAAAMTFVVIGGGPTGVEMAGAIAEISRYTLAKDFRHIDPRSARVILVEGEQRVLSSFPEDLSVSATKQLKQLGVEVRTGIHAKNLTDTGLEVGDEFIPCRVKIWAAGNAASFVGKTMGVPIDKAGRVIVNDDLTIPGHNEVQVIGDLANFSHQDGKTLPGVSPVAMQEGRHAVRNILAMIDGRKPQRFRYWNKGSMATIGRNKAVADLNFVHLSGLPAWVVWLFIHIIFLVGFRSRIAVLMQWAWSYVTMQRGVRLITGERLWPRT